MKQRKTIWQVLAESRARTNRAVSLSLTRPWPTAIAPGSYVKEYDEGADEGIGQ